MEQVLSPVSEWLKQAGAIGIGFGVITVGILLLLGLVRRIFSPFGIMEYLWRALMIAASFVVAFAVASYFAGADVMFLIRAVAATIVYVFKQGYSYLTTIFPFLPKP